MALNETEVPKILTPTDTITITIDNRTGETKAHCSRPMPFSYMVYIMSAVTQSFAQGAMAQEAQEARKLNPILKDLSKKQ